MKSLFENISALTDLADLLESVAWKSLAVLTLIFAATIFLRRNPAALRHLIWTVAFTCLLCLPVFMRCFPVWHPPTWAASFELNNRLPDLLKFDSEIFLPPKNPAAISATESKTISSASQNSSQTGAAVKPAVFDGRKIVALIWLAGMMIVLARILVAQIQLRRLMREMRICENPGQLEIFENLRRDYQIKRPVRLLISKTSTSPMTWGIWRPVIALPLESREWPDGRLRVVLRHELAHVRRWDCLTQELAQLACAFYWFNPLAWLAARRMRAEREKACDDLVLNAGARPAEYANHLVEIARQFSAAQLGGAVAMARPSGLESRVTAILDGRCNRNTIGKMTAVTIVFAVFGFGFLIGGCTNKNSPPKWSLKHSAVSAQLKSFVTEKEAQAAAAVKADGKEVPPEFKSFFAAATKGDWLTVSNYFEDFKKHAPQYSHPGSKVDERLRGTAWQAVLETWGVFDSLAAGSEKYSTLYATNIIDSIPAGSVYFGGTDPGRLLITGMEKSQINADPFFLLTQNALADGTYLGYLRGMYDKKIYIPTDEDSRKCFQDYVADARVRLQNHQLKAGEEFREDQGHAQVSGMVAVMSINGLLAKKIFDKNPDREFYIEESFPLDWMYPYLEPHGLIFKINRQPLPELSDEIVRRDHDYWTKMIQPMIGDWLNDDTSVEEITRFAAKVFLQHDFSDFTGDREFILNAYSHKMFSKERASIAGLYVWRMKNAAGSAEKERMAREADFAFRQALALCPYSPEAVTAYVALLMSENRRADALLVAETAAKMPEIKGRDGDTLHQLATVLANPNTKFK